jgi:hypothetical protein
MRLAGLGGRCLLVTVLDPSRPLWADAWCTGSAREGTREGLFDESS